MVGRVSCYDDVLVGCFGAVLFLSGVALIFAGMVALVVLVGERCCG